MHKDTRPDNKLRQTFLRRVYFGAGDDELALFMTRAYLDMNRTLHGVGKLLNAVDIQARAKQILREQFEALRSMPVPAEEDACRSSFDEWHQATCEHLLAHYVRMFDQLAGNRPEFHYGQAQKWINMTIKYCWVCGGPELDWLASWYPHAHTPVDNIILEAALRHKVIEKLPERSWSRWDQEIYRVFQRKFRAAAEPEVSSLELEFAWWMEPEQPSASGAEGL